MDDNLEIFIQDRWQLGHKIAEGGYGAVYTATDTYNGHEVAVKMMDMTQHLLGNPGNLAQEAQALRGVHGATPGGKRGIPRVLWDGRENDYYVMVTDLLGPSLDDLQTYCGDRFSDKTTLMVAGQAVSLLRTVHESGWLHRDIKPHNFLLGTGLDGNTIYSIDMGLSKSWDVADRERRRNPARRNAFIGTYDFSSLNSHTGEELSFKDDLESLGYVLIFMNTAELPWSPLADPSLWTPEMIREKKQNISIDQLCRNVPPVFKQYFRLVRKMDFASRPDYAKLLELFRRGLKAMGEEDDGVFDWTERMWRELYPPEPQPELPVLPPESSSE